MKTPPYMVRSIGVLLLFFVLIAGLFSLVWPIILPLSVVTNRLLVVLLALGVLLVM